MSSSTIMAAIARMESIGVASDDILDVVKDMLLAEPSSSPTIPKKSSAAIRQQRYRAKNTSRVTSRDVTASAEGGHNGDVTCDGCDVTGDAPSRVGAPADTQLTNLELYPGKKEKKNNVGLTVTPVTAGNVVGLFGETPSAAKPKAGKRKPTNQKRNYSSSFEILWETFPPHPHASKAKAFEAYERLPEEDRELALDGALIFLEYWKKRRQRFPDYDGPHLSTWINERRFESALEVRQQ